MVRDFYGKPFSDETKLKLELFRGYIREWIPVFFTQYTSGKQNYKRINIFDYFAGSGRDASGFPGSPLIVVDELKNYCEVNTRLKNSTVKVFLFFYDSDPKKINELDKNIDRIECKQGCCHIKVDTKPFEEALSDSITVLENQEAANLVIMDQFGISNVTPEVVSILARIETTDILFFITSSYLRRFKENQQFLKRQNIDRSKLGEVGHSQIHRFIYNHYRTMIPSDAKYYMAPFSIKKGGNIHGILFGSRSLFGLDKFLKVCWNLDPTTGEANYDIDDDHIRSGQLSLFPDLNVTTKERFFINSLINMLRTRSVNNHQLYQFVLERGYTPKIASAILRGLQKKGVVDAFQISNQRPARRGAFYITWDNYSKYPPRVLLRLLEP